MLVVVVVVIVLVLVVVVVVVVAVVVGSEENVASDRNINMVGVGPPRGVRGRDMTPALPKTGLKWTF